MIDIRKALDDALPLLDQTPDSPLEAELLLGHVLHKNRAYLFAHPELRLTTTQREQFQQLISLRAKGIPIAYLIGTRDFWSFTLKVNQHTLIPRHETELLVELALRLTVEEAHTQVLDLGTGSGAIALALAKERPHWTITACDYSQEALLIAQENAQNLGLNNVHFYHSNWFTAIPQIKYHTIVSNPPYIAEHDPHLKQGDLRFEPLNALASSQEGLADLQYILTHGYEYLTPGGLLLLEHGYDQKLAIQTILNNLSYKDIQCWQDIQGHDRVSGGKRPTA